MRIERVAHIDGNTTPNIRNLACVLDTTTISLSAIIITEQMCPSETSFNVIQEVKCGLKKGFNHPQTFEKSRNSPTKSLLDGTELNDEDAVKLAVKRKRGNPSIKDTSMASMSPQIDLQVQHELWAKKRDDLISFFIKSLSETLPVSEELTVIKDIPVCAGKSLHVNAFASMMTCASFWDEFVSMDQETKLPRLDSSLEEPPTKKAFKPTAIDCLGGTQLDPVFKSLPRNIEDALLSADISSCAIVITETVSPFLITYVNPAWVELCGYTSSDVVGHSLKCIQGKNTKSSTIWKIGRHLNAKVDCSARLTNYKKSGESFENLLRIVPLKNEIGCTTHFYGTLEECC